MPPPRKTPPLCPVELSLAVLCGRWKARIPWHLLEGPVRHGDLVQLVPGMTPRALTLALRELAADQVVERLPGQAGWRLTPIGDSLRMTLLALYDWGRSQQATRGDPAGLAVAQAALPALMQRIPAAVPGRPAAAA